MDSKRYLFLFEEGRADMRGLLGGKGANLAEMTRLGLPVPPGFTISTEACNDYYEKGGVLPEGLIDAVLSCIRVLEKKTGRTFGGRGSPLLVSVRSGAAISMPGMMDTILNLGLNDDTVEGLARETGDPRFAYDCYRRLIQMFGNVVLGVVHDVYERALSRMREKHSVTSDHMLGLDALKELIGEYKALTRFPQDPLVQLEQAITAVFRSWNNPRAQLYRKINKIRDDLGTAVNVQAMVFGNMGEDSGTGVLFTRNPSNGERARFGEYLTNAQGEDVVAGIRTPKPLSEMESELPDVYRDVMKMADLLERHYRDMQDIEFTFEKRRLYLLQTRTGKRTAKAAVKIAYDMVNEGLITKEEALMRVEPSHVEKVLHRGIDTTARLDVIASGLPASPGAATGEAVFDADVAEARGSRGERVILVRPETTPDDMHGIVHAQGILTSRGGMTCHAAIVARGMGKPCVVGCEQMRIDPEARVAQVNGMEIKEGTVISIDGSTGRVIMGEVPLVHPDPGDEFRELLGWADEIKRLGVYANADTPEDARRAREFGATGIGLCRTEHMFMAQDRLPVMQEMILAFTAEERKAALDKLLPMQKQDFMGILEAMEGYPVTIRLLDPPLHEFLPNIEHLVLEIERLRVSGAPEAEIKDRQNLLKKARVLAEANPMLGFRGCRLGMVYPEIYEMQAEAIFSAAAELIKKGVDARPEVMIPLVSIAQELATLRERINKVAEAVMARTGVRIPYTVGTMIEVPRAALTADEVAEYAEFFSFGTNDLTQTTYGFSRDDAEAKFLHHYIHERVLSENPFQSLDTAGVGQLIKMAVNKGRAKKPGLKIGICGEHGGDPDSIGFCHQAGLDYVSCSPFRVPVARLAAAQAQIAGK
ncbi:MAG: pyruvate, phosphate dikinase [Bacillota bacterium]